MYKLKRGGVVRIADGANIPDYEHNADWREYQEWLAQGNTPEPEYSGPELIELKRRAIESEAVRRISNVSGGRKAAVAMLKSVRIVARKASGQNPAGSEQVLSEIEAIEAAVDEINTRAESAINWLEDPARTREELEIYKPKIDPWR